MIRYIVIRDWVSGSVELRRWTPRKRYRGIKPCAYLANDEILSEPLPLIEAHRRKRQAMGSPENKKG